MTAERCPKCGKVPYRRAHLMVPFPDGRPRWSGEVSCCKFTMYRDGMTEGEALDRATTAWNDVLDLPDEPAAGG